MGTELEATVDSLLKRISMFLEDEDWDSATNYCERVLDAVPECSQAYIYKIMIEKKLSKQEELGKLEAPFDDTNDYKRAYKFSNDSEKALLDGYNQSIRDAKKQKIYEEALGKVNNAKTASDYSSICSLLGQIPDYKDSNELVSQFEEKAKTLEAEEKQKQQEESFDAMYKEACEQLASDDIFVIGRAENTFRRIADWKDSNEKINQCEEKIAYLSARNEKKTSIVLNALIVAGVVILLLEGVFAYNKYIHTPDKEYSEAERLYNSGKMVEASRLYRDLGGYRDSREKYGECAEEIAHASELETISKADSLYKAGQYEEAVQLYESVDSDEYKQSIEECKYNYAVEHLDRNDLTTYHYLYDLLNDNYKDTKALYDELYKMSFLCVVNDSHMTSEETNDLTYGGEEKDWKGIKYIHVCISGGTPEMDYIDIWGDALIYRNENWKGFFDYWYEDDVPMSGSSFTCRVKNGSWDIIADPLVREGYFPVSNEIEKTRIKFYYLDAYGEKCTYTVDMEKK